MLHKIWKILLVIFIVIVVAILMSPAFAATVANWFIAAGLTTTASLIMTLGLAELPWFVAAGVGIGLGYLIDPDTTTEIINDVATVAGKVGGAILNAAASAASAVWPWLLLVGGFFLLTKRKEQDDVIITSPALDSKAAKPGDIGAAPSEPTGMKGAPA